MLDRNDNSTAKTCAEDFNNAIWPFVSVVVIDSLCSGSVRIGDFIAVRKIP